MTRGASPQEMAECDCPGGWRCDELGCYAAGRDEPAPFCEPRWHWRNCRDLSVEFALFIWPWRFGLARSEDVYGGRRMLALGPIGIAINYSHGDVSREEWTVFDRIVNRTGLGESEAYERAERWEARP